MVFALYFLGSLVLVSGLAWVASALGAAPTLVTACAATVLAFAAAIGATALARTAR
jgi:hypothetical protein